MNFSLEYIAICRKLPHHEFEEGDYLLFSDHPDPCIVVELQFEGKGVRFVSLSRPVMISAVQSPRVCVWLPHRESDWMKMDGWGYMPMLGKENLPGVKPGYRICLFEWTPDGMEPIDGENDPLLACAKAWEKAVPK